MKDVALKLSNAWHQICPKCRCLLLIGEDELATHTDEMHNATATIEETITKGHGMILNFKEDGSVEYEGDLPHQCGATKQFEHVSGITADISVAICRRPLNHFPDMHVSDPLLGSADKVPMGRACFHVWLVEGS
jgi:hypothetical protein